MDKYFLVKFKEYSSLDIRFDSPTYPLIPSLAFKDKDDKTLFVFYNSGGMNQYDKIQKEIYKLKK